MTDEEEMEEFAERVKNMRVEKNKPPTPAYPFRNHKPIDPRPQRNGYAPGNYLGTCRTCGCGFTGDKRACQCADCAYIGAYRPPSCDKLATEKPKLKECPSPSCQSNDLETYDLAGHQWIVCNKCGMCGPTGFTEEGATRWNAIPRRSEVLELLRLVEEADKSRHEIGRHLEHFDRLIAYANKLRKEMEV